MNTLVRFERDQDVAVLTIDNPPVNALSPGVPEALTAAITQANADAPVRAIVVIGAGRTFIAGADVNEFQKPTAASYVASLRACLLTIEDSAKPVVMAIHGTALGGGLETAMAGHYRVITQSAQVGQPEVKLGLIAGYGGSQRLVRLVGLGRALELLLVGEPISAQRAYEIGLVNGVYPQAELIPQCEKWIQKMLGNGPVALKLTLEAAHRGIQMTLEEGLNLEATLFGLICTTEDMKEGTRAFLEKRTAQFKNR